MTKILRTIREYLWPEKRCDRVGHVPEVENIRILKEGGGACNVATEYKAKRDKCSHCRKILSDPYDCEYESGIQSLQMPKSHWDRMRNRGYLEQ